MGKKIKKDEKGPPDDVFDPLLIEAKQATTVVLMLSSPEEDVISRACEAIYKFVDKCDENKKVLLDLNAHDLLLNLLVHEERVIRRNAIMALGVIGCHPEGKRALRKKEETIPRLLSLMAPEEDIVSHEFAALCMASLATDFSSKIRIFEQNGLESLSRLLTSTDPDVQKSSIETVCLMLDDFLTRGAIREKDGLVPILDLIRSEYPVIQHLALVSLQKAMEDGATRAAFRDIEGINKMIEFVGRPDFSDLHVFAVMVISNCLEDPESMEQIKDNGGLAKLVAYITDAPPPEDEDTKSKGKKGGAEKGPSRAGKKGKEDASSARSPTPKGQKNDGRSPAEAVIATLPEVKEHAARAIARASKNENNRKFLHDLETERMLIALLSHEQPQVQVAAAQAVAVMCESLACRTSIGLWGGIEPLVKMVKHDNPDLREYGSLALANLTTSCMPNCNEVNRFHGIDQLVSLLSDQRELAIAYAAIVLTNMAPEEHLRMLVHNAGVVSALVEPLCSTNPTVQSKVAICIGAFVCDSDARTVFRENAGVGPLVAMLRSNDEDVRRSASWAITVLAADEATAVEILRQDALELLQDIQLSGTRKNAFTDVAEQKLLDCHLAAKYALKASLGPTNMIADGFFDVGSLTTGTKLLTLEEYYKEELNQRRAVLLVNAQPDKPQTPAPPMSEHEVTEKMSKSSVGGRSSRGAGRDKARQSGKKRDKEREKEKKAEQAAAAEAAEELPVPDEPAGPFVMPGDSNLMKYIEEVTDKVAPLPTTRDQAMALAVFVAEKLGGAIDRGQLANFSWELQISQLKFDTKSNVIPIGQIKFGIHYHRALLFKALADRIGLGASLERGDYNRAWNVVLVTEDDESAPGGPKFPPSAYLVDLVHHPGKLMPIKSPEAVNYQKL